MRKLFLFIAFGFLFVLTMLNIKISINEKGNVVSGVTTAKAELEIYCWSCGADICNNMSGFVCCWDSWRGYRNNCSAN